MKPLLLLRTTFALTLTSLAACGGKVVVDGSATGSGGGAPGSCDALLADLDQKIQAAQQCSPNLAVVQCTAVISDGCDCPVPVNELSADAVTAAKNAYQAAAEAGCTGACGGSCAGLGSSANCVPNGSGGTCVSVNEF
jgi:hypothetical protein